MFFQDRNDAGRILAGAVPEALEGEKEAWSVFGIARGGVIVAQHLAERFGIPLWSMCVEDFASEEGTLVVSSFGSGTLFRRGVNALEGILIPSGEVEDLLHSFGGGEDFLAELKRRDALYNDNLAVSVSGSVVLCDDGLVSGRSAIAAINALEAQGVERIILAVPVVPPWAKEWGLFEFWTWRVTRLETPTSGIFYFSFDDVPDEEVVRAIRSHR